MGHLSTHVLDTMHGCPAAGMKVTLQRVEGAHVVTLRQVVLNQDGRVLFAVDPAGNDDQGCPI